MHNNGKDSLGKFDPRGDEAIFLGYSLRSKAYKVYNQRTNKVEESIHVVFDESSVLQGVDLAQVDEFSFPRAQDSGSTSLNEDREQSPTHNVEALPGDQPLSPITQSIMKMNPPTAILTPLHEGVDKIEHPLYEDSLRHGGVCFFAGA